MDENRYSWRDSRRVLIGLIDIFQRKKLLELYVTTKLVKISISCGLFKCKTRNKQPKFRDRGTFNDFHITSRFERRKCLRIFDFYRVIETLNTMILWIYKRVRVVGARNDFRKQFFFFSFQRSSGSSISKHRTSYLISMPNIYYYVDACFVSLDLPTVLPFELRFTVSSLSLSFSS